jgi:hypothetical protein
MQNAKQMEVTIPWTIDEQSAERMRLFQRSRQSCARRSPDMGNIYLPNDQRKEQLGKVYEMPSDRCAAGITEPPLFAGMHELLCRPCILAPVAAHALLIH